MTATVGYLVRLAQKATGQSTLQPSRRLFASDLYSPVRPPGPPSPAHRRDVGAPGQFTGSVLASPGIDAAFLETAGQVTPDRMTADPPISGTGRPGQLVATSLPPDAAPPSASADVRPAAPIPPAGVASSSPGASRPLEPSLAPPPRPPRTPDPLTPHGQDALGRLQEATQGTLRAGVLASPASSGTTSTELGARHPATGPELRPTSSGPQSPADQSAGVAPPSSTIRPRPEFPATPEASAPNQRRTTPGQVSSTSAQADTRPGQAGTTPGQAGAASGHVGTTPGQVSPTPGQADTRPGQASPISGQAGPAPGQLRPAPGQADATPPRPSAAPRAGDPLPHPPAAHPIQRQPAAALQAPSAEAGGGPVTAATEGPRHVPKPAMLGDLFPSADRAHYPTGNQEPGPDGPNPRPRTTGQPRVSIGTIDVTVLPAPSTVTPPHPPVPQPSAPPTDQWQRPASTLSTGLDGTELRAGLRRWYGIAQG
jgi:hypothetical protein